MWRTISVLFLGTMAHGQERSRVQICRSEQEIDPVLASYLPSNYDPFCLSGGVCKQNFQETPEFPCECPDDRKGPHCEFHANEALPECDLECLNGGQCQEGLRSLSDIDTGLADLQQYCLCPPGFYGIACELQGQQCGNSHCFNGGQCVRIDHDDGTTTDHCDCNTAVREEDGLRFAGRFCQSPATSFCSNHAEGNGAHFCVNGGVCHLERHLGCECPSGFIGPVCEFREHLEFAHANCNLECYNHGICRKGVKDDSILQDFNFLNRRDLQETFNEDFEFCACPPGFVGLQCEVEMSVCPGRHHVCVNGGECIQDDSITTAPVFTCNCSAAEDPDVLFAGKFCQFSSTSFCTWTGEQPLSQAFCANDGVCKGFVDAENVDADHPGCTCAASFFGEHCQFSIEIPQPGVGGKRRGGRGILALSIVVVVFLVAMVMVAAVVFYRRERRRLKGSPRTHLNDGGNAFEPYVDSNGVFVFEKSDPEETGETSSSSDGKEAVPMSEYSTSHSGDEATWPPNVASFNSFTSGDDVGRSESSHSRHTDDVNRRGQGGIFGGDEEFLRMAKKKHSNSESSEVESMSSIESSHQDRELRQFSTESSGDTSNISQDKDIEKDTIANHTIIQNVETRSSEEDGELEKIALMKEELQSVASFDTQESSKRLPVQTFSSSTGSHDSSEFRHLV